jgi:hypothetical protein
MNCLKHFPELTNEFVTLANPNVVHYAEFICKRRFAGSGKTCDTVFVWEPKFAPNKCVCGMYREPVPIPPTCPTCGNTKGIRWAEESDNFVDESMAYDLIMTSRQAMVGTASDNGDYDPIQDSEEVDEIQMSINKTESEESATLEPWDYNGGKEYYEKKQKDYEEQSKISSNTAIKNTLLWAERHPPTLYQKNTCRKLYGFSIHPNITQGQASKLMKNIARLSKMIDAPKELYTKSERTSTIEEYLTYKAVLKTGNWGMRYNNFEYVTKVTNDGRYVVIPKELQKQVWQYPEFSYTENFLEMVMEDESLTKMR